MEFLMDDGVITTVQWRKVNRKVLTRDNLQVQQLLCSRSSRDWLDKNDRCVAFGYLTI